MLVQSGTKFLILGTKFSTRIRVPPGCSCSVRNIFYKSMMLVGGAIFSFLRPYFVGKGCKSTPNMVCSTKKSATSWLRCPNSNSSGKTWPTNARESSMLDVVVERWLNAQSMVVAPMAVWLRDRVYVYVYVRVTPAGERRVSPKVPCQRHRPCASVSSAVDALSNVG
eukprot:SAG31_NODE_2550_length_5515_cov_5.400849_1_plen_167_part_00